MEIRVKRVMLDEDENLAHSYESTNELYHWGIKGMKWGVRRYQNKDGSLTAAGQKRRSLGQYIHDKKVAKKRRAALEKARETKAKNAKERAKREKLLAQNRIPVKKMTDEELKRSMDRLNNEKKYLEQVRDTSTWKRFTNKFVNEVVIDGVSAAGKELAKSYLKEQGEKLLGLNQKSAYDKLKEAADSARFRKEIYENEQALENAKRNKQLNDDLTKAKAEADLAKNKKSAFENTRDLNESSKKYQQHLSEEAYKQEMANRDKQQRDGTYSKKGDGSTNYKEYVNYGTGGKLAVVNSKNTEAGKKAYNNSSQNNTPLANVKKNTVETGKAYVEDMDGNQLATVPITISKSDDD